MSASSSSRPAGLPHATFGFAHVNVVCVFGLPTDRELAVVGKRDADGAWAYVSLVCTPSAPVSEAWVASLSVEEARFMFADAAALRAWDHERSLDGLRDLVFWGQREAAVAAAVGAAKPYVAEDYLGWADLPPGACPPHLLDRIVEAEAQGALTMEVRPHSSHHAILKGVWRSADSAGTAVIGGATMCGLMSSVGDGSFPVVLERDAGGELCRVTVKIAGDGGRAR